MKVVLEEFDSLQVVTLTPETVQEAAQVLRLHVNSVGADTSLKVFWDGSMSCSLRVNKSKRSDSYMPKRGRK